MGDSDGRGLEVGDMASDENDWISELRDSNGINAADVVVLDLARRPAVNADRASDNSIVSKPTNELQSMPHMVVGFSVAYTEFHNSVVAVNAKRCGTVCVPDRVHHTDARFAGDDFH